MSVLDTFLERNREFAAKQSAAGTLMPSLPAGNAQCKSNDHRVRRYARGSCACAGNRIRRGRGDPQHWRPCYARPAPAVRATGENGEVAGKNPGGSGDFHLIVLHHTDCGITRLTGEPVMLSQYFQIAEADVKTKAVNDPRAAVTIDVASLRANPALPGAWIISGLVYDVSTGLVETVVPAAPIRPQ
jgi:carbonic anhydrase